MRVSVCVFVCGMCVFFCVLCITLFHPHLQLSILDRNQREMNQLLGRARSLEGQHIPRGAEIVQFFHDAHLELDSLTATLKTTADCITVSGQPFKSKILQFVAVIDERYNSAHVTGDTYSWDFTSTATSYS